MQRSNDIRTGLYGGAQYLARWTLVGGHPRCPDAPLVLATADEQSIGGTLAINRAVAALAAAAEQYEAAARLRAGQAPDQWVHIGGDDGAPVTVENPAWAAWIAAGETLAGAGAELLHLVRTRADQLDDDEDGYELVLPALPPFDPRGETVDLVDGVWVVRALTESELTDHPLRPAAFMSKMDFAALLISTLGDALGTAVIGMYGSVLALAQDVDWIDVFDFLNGDPTKPGYAAQLLAEGAVTVDHIAELRAGWVRSCKA